MVIIIGNIIALVASLIMVYSGILKEKKKILFFQTLQIGITVISNIVLGGFTGAINNILNCVRNILCYKDKLGLKERIIITILSIIFTLLFNDIGLIGLLPLISSVAYIWLMNVKDVIKFKYLVIFNISLWFIYDFYIKAYIFAIFEFITIATTCISIIQIIRKKNK